MQKRCRAAPRVPDSHSNRSIRQPIYFPMPTPLLHTCSHRAATPSLATGTSNSQTPHRCRPSQHDGQGQQPIFRNSLLKGRFSNELVPTSFLQQSQFRTVIFRCITSFATLPTISLLYHTRSDLRLLTTFRRTYPSRLYRWKMSDGGYFSSLLPPLPPTPRPQNLRDRQDICFQTFFASILLAAHPKVGCIFLAYPNICLWRHHRFAYHPRFFSRNLGKELLLGYRT